MHRRPWGHSNVMSINWIMLATENMRFHSIRFTTPFWTALSIRCSVIPPQPPLRGCVLRLCHVHRHTFYTCTATQFWHLTQPQGYPLTSKLALPHFIILRWRYSYRRLIKRSNHVWQNGALGRNKSSLMTYCPFQWVLLITGTRILNQYQISAQQCLLYNCSIFRARVV